MKKLFLSILAVATLASCSKTESAYVDQDQEIKLAPVASMLTKVVHGAIDGTEYPADEHFTVKGYWAKEDAGSTFAEGTTYLDAVDFARKGLYWAGSQQAYYWPKNGSLRFACYSPTEIEGGTLAHDLANDTWTATDYVQSNDTEETVDFMVAQTPPSYTAQTAAENVSVVFEHALSWIEFKVKAENEEAAAAFDVKAITINGVSTKGQMVAKYPEKKWTVSTASDDIKPYAVCTDAPALAVEPTLVPNTGVLVIPQNTTTANITFTQNTLEDADGELVEQNLDVSLVLDANNSPWEPGKHYIYTIIFGLDEILINPSVEDWEDVVVNDIEAGTTNVYSAAQLAAALAADEENISVTLTADMDLTATEMHVAAGKNVVVDLGGQTVNVKALDPIKNLGTMTLKNGKVVAENSENTRRCVYNYGTMIIEDVEFVQTYDMKGAAINNEGIMTINNATVNAKYYSVWTSGANSETIINGGKFTTTNTVGKEDAHAYAMFVANGGKLTINNAEVSGNHGAVCAYKKALATLNSGTFTLATPCFTPGGNSSWVLYAEEEGVINYSQTNCTLVKPDTKTNGYNTTAKGGIVKSF